MSAHLTVHDLLVHATILLVCSSFAAPQPIQKGLNTMEQYFQEKVVEKESYKVVESYLGICGIFPCPLFRTVTKYRTKEYYKRSLRYVCVAGARLDRGICKKDCILSKAWNAWSACTESCYQGVRKRTIDILQKPSNGGINCPSTSQTESCNVGRTQCNIAGKCYDNGHVTTTSTTCQECNFHANRQAWIAHSGSTCHDGNSCTKDDKCTNGKCGGTAYTCSESCTTCNGQGGCSTKFNFCFIDTSSGPTCYSDGDPNPDSPYCQDCSFSIGDIRARRPFSSSSWTNKPENTVCQHSDLCIRNPKCNSNGQCVGVDYRHECVTECQACSESGSCVTTRGCLKDGKCGCQISTKCYGERETNPSSQCHYCKTQENANGWTPKEDGSTCNDSNACTYRDVCVAGTCRGTAYACTVGEDQVCMSANTCDGDGNCNPTFHRSSKLCYSKQDECDHENTYCSGTQAVCAITTRKQLAGTPITLGTITLVDDSRRRLPTTATDSGEVALTSSTGRLNVQLSNFQVPCGGVWYSAAIRPYPDVPAQANLGTGTATGISGQTVSVEISASLRHGAQYRITVEARNLRANTVNQLSLPVLVDTSGPSLTSGLNDGPLSQSEPINRDINFQTSLTQLIVNWKVADLLDAESGVDLSTIRMSYAKSSAPSVTLVQYASCASAQRDSGYCTLSGLSLEAGTRYIAYLAATNLVGLTASSISNGIVPDNTAPSGGRLGMNGLSSVSHDPQYAFVLSAAGLSLDATLSGVSDAESGLKTFSYILCDQDSALCTESGHTVFSCSSRLCDINLEHAGDRLTSQGNFVNNRKYVLTVKVENNAGLSSDIRSEPFLVDRQIPSAGSVYDGTVVGSDMAYQSATGQVSVNWAGFSDAESGISAYGLELLRDGQQIATGTVAASQSAYMFSETLLHGSTYVSCVTARDYGSNVNRVCSNGVLIDAVPPTGGKVNDIDPAGASLADIDYQALPTTIKAMWSGFQALSGIQSYSWSIGTTAGSSDTLARLSVGLLTTASKSGLSLASGQQYFVNVWCTSRSGVTSLVSSDGVLVDTSAPNAGTVLDICTGNIVPCTSGENDDIDFSPDNAELRASWSGFSDAESGIVRYEWNYADCSSMVGLHATYRDAALNTQFRSLVSGSLDSNVRYCVVVRSINNAGLSTSVWTDGYLVDTTAPQTFQVMDGRSASDDIDHQKDVSMLNAVWQSPNDGQSDVEYQTSVVKQTSAFPAVDVTGKVRLSKDATSHTFMELGLTDLETYAVEVCAVNRAGLEQCSTSDGVLIDTTAPTQGLVFTGLTTEGKHYQSSTSSLQARWHSFLDLHSDIAHFSWSILSSSTGAVVRAKENVGMRTEASATGLLLNSGEQYVVVVEAVNNAGGAVESRSEKITIDSTPPVNGMKPVLTFDGNTAKVAWQSFRDDESSIWYYKWSVGVEPFGNQITGCNMASNSTTMAEMPGVYVTGQVYYATVIARNRAGLWTYENHGSVAVVFDATAPVMSAIAIVDKQSQGEVTVASPTTQLLCKWTPPTDAESAVSRCEVRIVGNTTGNVADRSDVDVTSTSYDVPVSILSGGESAYKCVLQCWNAESLSTSITSDPVAVDSSPPTAGQLDVMGFWTHKTYLEVSWSPCTDDQSAITSYEWEIVDSASSAVSATQVESGSTLSGRVDGISLSHGEQYAVRMRCANEAGLTSEWTSSQFTVDMTAPSVSTVTAYIRAMQNAVPESSPTYQLSATWRAAVDSESDVTGYRWSVGTTPGGCQLAEYSLPQVQLTAACAGCTLRNGETYYVTVAAVNGAGLTADSSSQPVTMDTTAPRSGQVEIRSVSEASGEITARCHSFVDYQTKVERCKWVLSDRQSTLATGALTCSCSDCTFTTSPLPTLDRASLQAATQTPMLQVMCEDVNNQSSTAQAPVDLTAPNVGQIACKAFAASASQVTAVVTGLSDFQSPSVQLRWKVSTSGMAEQAWRTDGVTSSSPTLKAMGLSLQEQLDYSLIIEATNAQDLTVTTSCSFQLDMTPPTQGTVKFAAGSQYVSSLEALSIEWSDIQDQQSGISKFEWCLSSPGQLSNRVMCQETAGTVSTAHCRTCPVVAGSPYTVRVEAVDNAGLSTVTTSNAVTLDTSVPTAGSVYEGQRSGDDIDYVKSTSMLGLQFAGFADTESGIDRCRVDLVQTQEQTVVWTSTVTSDQSSLTRDSAGLPSGVSLTTRVTCWNRAGLSVSNTSDGIAVDSSAPAFTAVRRNVVYTGAAGQADIQIWLDGVEDGESGVESASVLLINAAQDRTVYSINQMDFSSFFTISEANMTQGDRYYIKVTIQDRAGWVTARNSSEFVFDATPASLGFVNDGSGEDIDYTSDTSTVMANWDTIADADSSISHYDWAVGTTPGGTQVLAYTPTGSSTSASCSAPACLLEAGLKYYVTVRATNAAKLQSWFKSDGFVVDSTPPLGTSISINGGSSVEFISSGQVLQVDWSDTTKDYESPVKQYSACLSSIQDTCSSGAMQPLGLLTKTDFTVEQLASGSPLYVVVWCENAAGLVERTTSWQLTVDNSPPSAGVVTDGETNDDIDCQPVDQPITASWQGFVDEQSGIRAYHWAIGSKPLTDDIQPWTNVQLQTSGMAMLNGSKIGDVLYSSIRAYNKAELFSQAASDGIRLQSTTADNVAEFCMAP
ncbi:uncharacterized protein LOC135804992 [Sycon ciliatum]|uniref:uncharacterized protein LOC135804992 n=1 Tax=Sycon ciliatum TaxID=27933 RepID=UPI0031F6121F